MDNLLKSPPCDIVCPLPLPTLSHRKTFALPTRGEAGGGRGEEPEPRNISASQGNEKFGCMENKDEPNCFDL